MPVNNDRDEIDTWLDAGVQPLPPPPGTFDRVSRQARRRKAGRAIVSAAVIYALRVLVDEDIPLNASPMSLKRLEW